MMMRSCKLLLLAIVSAALSHAAQDCCLCDDCDFMMRLDSGLFDIDTYTFVSCERFAEELFDNFVAESAQCTMAQDLFQAPCCYGSQSDRHLSWGASTTTYPFQSSSFRTPSSYSSWGVTQQQQSSPAVSWGSSAPQTYSTGQVFTANPLPSAGGSCPHRSGICNFNCPNVPADRGAIHVSVDPSITGRNLPYFGALCGDVQNQMHCQNIVTSDLRCSLMVSRYRGECGCGGYQNNGASFWGTTQS